MVGREPSVPAGLMEREVGMGGDDADAREEEGGRRAASDAGEGDACGDMTFVVEGVLVEVVGSVGGERRVEEGERVRAGLVSQLSWLRIFRPLTGVRGL